MVNSMTGYASATGGEGPFSWNWELRSVNGRGLDLRLRVPDWIQGLEVGLRGKLGKAVSRGSLTLSLKVQRDEANPGGEIDTEALGALLTTMESVGAEAGARGLVLSTPSVLDVVNFRGIMKSGDNSDEVAALARALERAFPALLKDFLASRATEGAALRGTIMGQLDQIEALTCAAAEAAIARQGETAARLKRNLAMVLDNADGADPDRVAQELALLAVKADVTEEIDRLTAHVTAARTLLGVKGPVGRKLDFLTQEFNREANTLCSKSGASDLTRIGLDLKATIDQMREQVQNVE